MSMMVFRGAVVGAAMGLLAAGQAFAQAGTSVQLEPPPPDAVITGVTVSLPKVIDRTKYGLVTSDISMSVVVPYSDLDMATAAGVAELDRRVLAAGDYACTQLERMYPDGSPETRACVRAAVSDAQPQVIQARLAH